VATSLEELEKEARIEKIHVNTFHSVKKIVKIGPADPEIIWLKLKEEEMNTSKIYSPVGKIAEQATYCHSVYGRQFCGSQYHIHRRHNIDLCTCLHCHTTVTSRL